MSPDRLSNSLKRFFGNNIELAENEADRLREEGYNPAQIFQMLSERQGKGKRHASGNEDTGDLKEGHSKRGRKRTIKPRR